MVIELVRKEMINRRAKKTSSTSMRILKVFLKLVFYALIISAICFVFTSIDNKISNYTCLVNSSKPCLEGMTTSKYGSLGILVLALFAVMVIGVISSVARARRVIFNVEDTRITTPLPISSEVLIFSKVIYIYAKECATSLILATPMMFCYGLVRTMFPSYFIFALFYPFIISIFTVGLSLIFVVIYEYIYRVIKTSDIVQFVLAALLVIGLCYVYQFVLNLFLSALNDSSVGGMLSPEFVSALDNGVQFLLPVFNLISAVVLNSNVASNVMIFIGLLIVVNVFGFYIISIVFHYFNIHDLDIKVNNKRERQMKIMSPLMALLKKEFEMLFKDSAYTFSYTALLIMAPFLSFVVISSLNAIVYKNLEIFMVYYPELINGINIVLVLLFMSVINSSATLSMSREGKAVQIVKYIPVPLYKQILAKVLIPMILSFVSLLITSLVLVITNSITFMTFIMIIFIGIILIVGCNIFGLQWDMHDKSSAKTKLSSLNIVLAVGYPCFILAIHFVLVFFTNISTPLLYSIESICSLILLFACLFKVKKRMKRAFLKMEAN